MQLKSSLTALALTFGFSSVALAADPVVYSEPAPVDYGFDWDGPYVGLLLGYETYSPSEWFHAGGAIGLNTVLDSDVLFNVEGSLAAYWGDDEGYEAELNGRLGLVLDDVVPYVVAGIGTDSGDYGYFTYGAGIWLGVADNLSLRAELTGNSWTDGSGYGWTAAEVGAFLHF